MPYTQIDEPTGWRSVRTAYRVVRDKYMTKPEPGKRLIAINYFMDRLQQDKDAILDGKQPPDY